MTVAQLDLNDCNLQLWHGSRHVQSPGYALLQDGAYHFGAQARAAARLRPRDVSTRFWWQLGTQPLQPALGKARHTADLAHAHLLNLYEAAGQPQEVLLAVPGSMQHDQLSLLLGIVQQCPFDAVGLVNRSVALASLGGGRAHFHLELQLHQALLTELATDNGRVSLQRSTPLPGCGLLQLQERLVERIAAAFVRQTRFDPRRKAESEQVLYDALPGALGELARGSEAIIEVNGYRTRIETTDLASAGERLVSALRNAVDDNVPVVADPLAALLPGLENQFPNMRIAAAADVRSALSAHESLLVQRSEALDFVTALPLMAEPAAATDTAPAAPESAPAPVPEPEPAAAEHPPTHLLRDAVAAPLVAAGTPLANGWELFSTDGNWQLRGAGGQLTVNGAVYTPGQALGAGDEIGLGAGRSALLITVKD